MPSTEISIVIPIYNSGQILEELANRLTLTMSRIGSTWEAILVNDASPDRYTWEKIVSTCTRDAHFSGINLLYNVGQFRATICGLSAATGQIVVTMDDDLQHPPEELPKLLEAIRNAPEVDCVMGTSVHRKHSWWRNLGSKAFASLLQSTARQKNKIRTSSFRAMRLSVAKAICSYRAARPVMGAITLQVCRKPLNISVEHHPRKSGKSGYSLPRLIGATLDTLIYRSTLPIRMFTALGFTCSALSISIGIIVFARWLYGGIGVEGYASTMILTTFFFGSTMMGLGIVGEYVARIIAEVSGPKQYVVRETIGTNFTGEH